MQYGDLQKMNTLMLCDIIDTLNIKSGYDTELIKTAVNLGHLWAIEIAYPGHIEDADIPEEVGFINDILHLFDVLKSTFNSFNTEEKMLITEAIPDFSEKHDLTFYGFNAEMERNMNDISRLLLLLGYHSGRDLLKNALTPTTGRYTQMLDIFFIFNGKSTPEDRLPPDVFCEIVNAGRVTCFIPFLPNQKKSTPQRYTCRH
ncbi:hypothetical protein D3C79_126300 [compost metagenome]